MNFPEGGRYPKIFQRGLPCISSGPQFVDSSRPHLCRYTPSWAHALLSSAPALSPAAQDMVLSRGQPESSPPTAYWMSCARRPPQTMEPWPNRLWSYRAGGWLGHTLVDQEALVLPASTGLLPWLHRALPGACDQSTSCLASTSDNGALPQQR